MTQPAFESGAGTYIKRPASEVCNSTISYDQVADFYFLFTRGADCKLSTTESTSSSVQYEVRRWRNLLAETVIASQMADGKKTETRSTRPLTLRIDDGRCHATWVSGKYVAKFPFDEHYVLAQKAAHQAGLAANTVLDALVDGFISRGNTAIDFASMAKTLQEQSRQDHASVMLMDRPVFAITQVIRSMNSFWPFGAFRPLGLFSGCIISWYMVNSWPRVPLVPSNETTRNSRAFNLWQVNNGINQQDIPRCDPWGERYIYLHLGPPKLPSFVGK